MDFKRIWYVTKKKTKRAYKKTKRWIKRYIRLLVRHTKAKDYSVLMYTIFAVIAFILVIVLFGKLFSAIGGNDKKDKPKTTASTELSTPADATAGSAETAKRQLADQCKIIYDGNKELMLLVNDSHPLDENYTFEHHTLNCGFDVDERAFSDLSSMLSACNEAGNEYNIISGYRSREEQQTILDNDIQAYMNDGLSEDEAYSKALTAVQKPGCSEHETGLALDIAGVNMSTLEEYLADEPTNQWLIQNCHKYGFILRYPQDKTEITKISFEPWHFRYVGKEAAAFLHNNDLTLEEFHELLTY